MLQNLTNILQTQSTSRAAWLVARGSSWVRQCRILAYFCAVRTTSKILLCTKNERTPRFGKCCNVMRRNRTVLVHLHEYCRSRDPEAAEALSVSRSKIFGKRTHCETFHRGIFSITLLLRIPKFQTFFVVTFFLDTLKFWASLRARRQVSHPLTRYEHAVYFSRVPETRWVPPHGVLQYTNKTCRLVG